MELTKDLYTVQEVAQIIGKSVQAVYLRLDNLAKDGKEYTTTGTDGKKRVKKEFIVEFYGDTIQQQQQGQSDNAELHAELAALRARTEEQQKLIEQLQDRISAQQDIIENLQQMNKNNQTLLLQATQNQTLMLQATQQGEGESAPEQQQPQEEKKSFWSFFKKNV